jgi:hypothetical protein
MLAILAALIAAPGIVSPYDQRIAYIGRFDRRSTVGPLGSWPGVDARVRVQGAGLQVTVQESGHDWLQILVDGVPTQAVPLAQGVQTIEVRAQKPGVHVYDFVKRTEPLVGSIQYLEFEPEGRLLKATEHARRLQVIGDSIVCGYGNEASSSGETFSPVTENASLSFASIAARDLDADAELIAWSGRKMWPDDTIASIYDLDVPTDPSSTHGFHDPAPEAILIEIGTEDFSKQNPDEGEWVGAYEGFVARLRLRYPKTMIYAAIGPMMSDTNPEGHRALSTIRDYLTRMVDRLRAGGDPRIRLIEFDPQNPEDGIGADFHPNVTTHRKMALKLEQTLKRDLKW